jgi:DNA repair exonuclease SbcCD nuclease subunit
MKILFIGDPHLKISKFDLSRKFLAWIGNVIEEVNPDLVVNLGDTFDTHAVVRSEVLAEFKKHVERCPVPYLYVLGNHDMYKPNDSTYHALQAFSMEGFRVIDKPTDIGDITYVPYIHDFENFPKETKSICVAHQTFVGADYGYYRPDVGVDADKVSADVIISGHVHKRQTFGKVTYPGTPFSHDLNDIDQEKGIMVFDTETYKMEYIYSPFPGWRSMKFDMSDMQSVDDLHTNIEKTIDDINNWVIDVTGPKAEIVSYLDSKKWLNLQKKHHVRVRPIYTDSNRVEKKKISSVNMSDIVCEYIDNIYSGSLDKSVLKDKAAQLLNNTDESNV